jgi:hypothetical protein
LTGKAQTGQETTGLSLIIDHPIIKSNSVSNSGDQEAEVLMRIGLEEVAEIMIDLIIIVIKTNETIINAIATETIGLTSTINKVKIITMNRQISRNKEVITHLQILKQQQDTKDLTDDIAMMISQRVRVKVLHI